MSFFNHDVGFPHDLRILWCLYVDVVLCKQSWITCLGRFAAVCTLYPIDRIWHQKLVSRACINNYIIFCGVLLLSHTSKTCFWCQIVPIICKWFCCALLCHMVFCSMLAIIVLWISGLLCGAAQMQVKQPWRIWVKLTCIHTQQSQNRGRNSWWCELLVKHRQAT